MKATRLEFKLRFWIILLIYMLGFWAPWDRALHLDGTGLNAHVWGWMAVLLSRGGAMGIGAAFNLVLAAGIVFAVAGAALRTWGTAYLSAEVMRDRAMQGDKVLADGPYRYVRNPLYLGSWLFTLALALLMPPSGAIFCVVAMVAFLLRLMLGEEAFLREKLGEPYAAYLAKVPRIVPSLRKPTSQGRDVGHPIPSSGRKPRWGQAALAEILMWGVAGSFAVAGWWYDAHLLMQCVLVSLGVSMVVRGLAMPEKAAA